MVVKYGRMSVLLRLYKRLTIKKEWIVVGCDRTLSKKLLSM